MKTLSQTDYVIYNQANDQVISWESNGEIVIFGDIKEAEEDCRGNEIVIKCTELPEHHQKSLLEQINKIQ